MDRKALIDQLEERIRYYKRIDERHLKYGNTIHHRLLCKENRSLEENQARRYWDAYKDFFRGHRPRALQSYIRMLQSDSSVEEITAELEAHQEEAQRRMREMEFNRSTDMVSISEFGAQKGIYRACKSTKMITKEVIDRISSQQGKGEYNE